MWNYRTKSWDKWNPFSTYWSWCTCRFVVQNTGIDRSRNAWAMSAWKRRTSFAPTHGLHISGYVPRKHRYMYCNSHISSYEWKIWIIKRPYGFMQHYYFYIFHIHISLKQWKLISDNTFQKLLKCKPCVGAKLVLRFSGAHNSYMSWSINTIFVPRISMYIRININQTDFIYLQIWYNSVIFCQRGLFLLVLYVKFNNPELLASYKCQKIFHMITMWNHIAQGCRNLNWFHGRFHPQTITNVIMLPSMTLFVNIT